MFSTLFSLLPFCSPILTAPFWACVASSASIIANKQKEARGSNSLCSCTHHEWNRGKCQFQLVTMITELSDARRNCQGNPWHWTEPSGMWHTRRDDGQRHCSLLQPSKFLLPFSSRTCSTGKRNVTGHICLSPPFFQCVRISEGRDKVQTCLETEGLLPWLQHGIISVPCTDLQACVIHPRTERGTKEERNSGKSNAIMGCLQLLRETGKVHRTCRTWSPSEELNAHSEDKIQKCLATIVRC